MMLDVNLSIDYNENTLGWIKLADECEAFQDSCLAEAENQGLKKLSAKFDYKLVAAQLKDMIVRRADSATRAAIIKRANWASVSDELGAGN